MVANSTGGTSHGSGTSPVFSFDEFVYRTECWGINVCNMHTAEALFRSLGYGRLLPYLAFVRKSRMHRKCTVLELAQLVSLDAKIRSIALEAIGVIETSFKQTYAQEMHSANGAACLLDAGCFKRKNSYRSAVRSIEFEARRQSAQVRRSGVLTPQAAWLGLECASLGVASKLFFNTRSSTVTAQTSAAFSSNSRCLKSWIHCLVLARDRCAHFMPFVVLSQIPAVPKLVYGYEGDPTSPLYALIVIERLLAGRAEAGFEGAKDALHNFVFEATETLSQFARRNPQLARRLRIPKKYTTACSMKRARATLARSGSAFEYASVAIAAA